MPQRKRIVPPAPVVSEKFITLLHFDGEEGGTTFTDESGRLWASGGAAITTTAEHKFGTAAYKGNTDQTGGIKAPAAHRSPWFPNGTPTTVDCWFKSSSGASFMTLFSSTDGNNGIKLFLNTGGADGKLALATCVSVSLESNRGYNDGNWHHVAVVHNPGYVAPAHAWALFVDGTLRASSDTAAGSFEYGDMTIGSFVTGNKGFNGNIDEFAWRPRAVWTADFTPPTAAYTWV